MKTLTPLSRIRFKKLGVRTASLQSFAKPTKILAFIRSVAERAWVELHWNSNPHPQPFSPTQSLNLVLCVLC